MKIRPRKNPSGKIVWQVDFGEGKGGRKSYKTKGKAQRALEDELDRRLRHGRMADGISAPQMAEMVTAFHQLQEAGASITEAKDFYLANARRLREPLALAEMLARYRDSRERLDLSAKYVPQLRVAHASLCLFFPLKLAHELTAIDVHRWINSGTWSAKTRSNYLGDVSAAFAWALLPTQGYARINPCLGVEREPKKRRGVVSTLKLEQAEQMLRAAWAQQDWRVLVYLVLGLFGGLRPEEASYQGLVWDAVNLKERTVRLSEEVVKTGPGRVVDLTAAAVEWLCLVPEELRKETVVHCGGWLERWKRFRHGQGWQVATEKGIRIRCYPAVEAVHGPWLKDVLRHTFASFHYAEHQNEPQLQVQMGHRSAKMIHEHYRAVKTRQEAAVFWGLKPE